MQAPTRRRTTPVAEEEGRVVEKSQEVGENQNVVAFVAQIFLDFVFWSAMSEAVPALWYIPMNLMEISGVEPFLFLYALMATLTFRVVREATWNVPALNLASVVCLISLHMPNVLTYGAAAMITSSLALVLVVGQLLNPVAQLRERRLNALLLGLLSLVVVRFGLSSVSPLYLYENANIFAIILSIVCTGILHQAKSGHIASKPITKSFSSLKSDIATSAGFGSFLLLNIMFLSEHGVLARWDNADPFVIGLSMMACMVLGIFLGRHSFVRSWLWWILAMIFTLAFIIIDTPVGAACGLFLVVYLVSIWPAIVEELTRVVYIGRGFTVAGLFYTFGCLGTVWCIAYNFVPGGFFVREYTPQLVVLSLLSTKMAYSTLSSSTSGSGSSSNAPREKTSAGNQKLLLIGLALIALLVFTPAFLKRFSSYNNFDANGLDKSNLRGMVWATHFGYDNFGRPSYEAMYDLIKKSSANVIALVETDVMRLFNGNRDVTEWLQEKLHMYLDYGPGTNTHTWGCAILSAYPFKRVERVVLPSPDGENACLIDVTIDMNGQDVDIIMAHFGNTEHVRDRHLQTEDSYKRLKARVDAGKKVAWLGYFTSAPGSVNYNKIMSTGVIDTTDSKDRYCEYIWYKNMKLKEFKRIAQGHVSDTEIQYAEFEPF
jgi:endonuclease/exonuclease/phosphatase family metal-dependent hydrolase